MSRIRVVRPNDNHSFDIFKTKISCYYFLLKISLPNLGKSSCYIPLLALCQLSFFPFLECDTFFISQSICMYYSLSEIFFSSPSFTQLPLNLSSERKYYLLNEVFLTTNLGIYPFVFIVIELFFAVFRPFIVIYL